MTKPVIMLVIPNLGGGGAQAVFRQQLEFYSERFTTVGVVFNMDGATKVEQGLKGLVSLHVPGGRTWFSKLLNFVRRANRLKAIKRRNGVTVAISHLEGADYVNCLSRGNEKVICWIHGTKKHDGEIKGLLGLLRDKLLIPFLYRRSDRIITVSDGIAAELTNHYGLSPNVVSTLQNGIDVDNIMTLKNQSIEHEFIRMCDKHPVLISHSRLARQKNLRATLAIFSEVRRQKIAKLVILGDGEERIALVAFARSLPLVVSTSDREWDENADVFFLGYKENPYPYLRAAHLYLLTSLWEGFPLAICEAIVCGLPIVASDCYTGPREILQPTLAGQQPVEHPTQIDCGFLMPVPDSEKKYAQWSDVIVKALSDQTQLERWSIRTNSMWAKLDSKRVKEKWLSIVQ